MFRRLRERCGCVWQINDRVLHGRTHLNAPNIIKSITSPDITIVLLRLAHPSLFTSYFIPVFNVYNMMCSFVIDFALLTICVPCSEKFMQRTFDFSPYCPDNVEGYCDCVCMSVCLQHNSNIRVAIKKLLAYLVLF